MSNVHARKIFDLVGARVVHIGHSSAGRSRDIDDALLERGDGDLDHMVCEIRAGSRD